LGGEWIKSSMRERGLIGVRKIMGAGFCFWCLLVAVAGQGIAAEEKPDEGGAAARRYSVQVLTRIAEPVLSAAAEGRLKSSMPAGEWEAKRRQFAPLEALGRLLAGMGPWLELGPAEDEEGKLRGRFGDLAVKAIGKAVDPKSPDFMNFNKGGQPLVDAAFLAHGILRAPNQLWGKLSERDRTNLVAALESTRVIKPGNNNWLLFSAMVEAMLWHFTDRCETKPIETAVIKHLEWYKGDGVYGDGPEFHWDYYNSYVIQPMLLDVLRVCSEKHHPLGTNYNLVLRRAKRYAAVQERLISPEATYPVLGRSSAYRFGCFQALSQIALMHELEPEDKPGAVRSALTAVIRRTIEAPGTFDNQGWLQVGVAGHQPSIRESYISTGSLYLCAVGMLHLGLPADDPFWTAPAAEWTQKRIWSGEDVRAEHALSGR
jgi:hypothetical protein